MAIHYVLVENHLTSDPDDYTALVLPTDTAELEDVIARMIDQGSTVVKADILSVLEDYEKAIESILLEGRNVNTPSANYGASIKGVFNGQADGYDPSRHQVRATASPGKRLRRAIEERAEVSKGEAVTPTPNPLEYTDLNSEARNSVLTPGGMGRLVGHRLKFDPTAADQGIFFVAADGTATQVQVVGRNKPAELMFLVPEGLAPGEYTLEVRAVLPNRNDLRTGALKEPLTVA